MTLHSTHVDHAIDIRSTRPRLREGLRFVPQSGRTRAPWFRIEDDLCNRFHRIGLAEYELLLAFDGHRTLEQAREQGALSSNHQHVLTAEHSESLVLWAAEEGLLDGHFHPRQAFNPSRRSSLAWIKVPLSRGDAGWQPLAKATGWLFAPVALCGSIALWLVAGCMVLLDRDRFVNDVSIVLSPNAWLMLAGVWLLLKVIHELGHLVCCQRHGGRVGEVGIAWMLVAPVAYVDLTDLYRMESRRKRVLTCLAGIFAELNVAALAILVWAWTGAAAAGHLLATIAVTASAGSLLFNLNPLMRLDGYHALCDWIGRPNLAAEGAKAMRAAVARIFFGRKRNCKIPEARLAVYGFAVVAYQILVSFGLAAAALSMYGRTGLLIVAPVMVMIAMPMLTRLWLTVCHEVRSRPAVLARLTFVSVLLVASGAAAWQGVGAWQTGWCGVVEYVDDAPVRCGSAGKVIRVCVEAGQRVRQGDELVEMENLALRAELVQAQCELAAGQSKWKRLRESYLPAEAASEQKSNEAIQARVAHLARQVNLLVLRAPRDGTVVALDIDQWAGKWFDEGEAVLYVVNEANKKVVVAIPQDDVDRLGGKYGNKVECRSPAGLRMSGIVTSITHQASLSPPHPALAASAGGPLAVRPEAEQEQVVLLSPHLRLEATVLDAENRLFPGQSVRVTQ